jgi:hypothetical protein
MLRFPSLPNASIWDEVEVSSAARLVAAATYAPTTIVANTNLCIFLIITVRDFANVPVKNSGQISS